MSESGISDMIGNRIASVLPLHPTKSAVSTPKNLQLAPNLEVETITSWKTSRKAPSWVSIYQSFTVITPLRTLCFKFLSATGSSITTAINQITPHIIIRTMLDRECPIMSLNFKFFFKICSGERLK